MAAKSQNNHPMQSDSPHAICGAKTRSGKKCQARPMANGRCRMHGGKSLRGAESPTFRTGTHTDYLPTRMVAAYQAALNDPELLDLNQSIALIDSRVIDLLGRVDTGESGQLWKDIGKAYAELRAATDGVERLKAFAKMDILIDKGLTDYAAWSEVGRLLEDRRKHVETKQKVELQGERAVSANELMTFMGAVLNLIQSTVSSKDERIKIANGIEQLITPRTQQIQ